MVRYKESGLLRCVLNEVGRKWSEGIGGGKGGFMKSLRWRKIEGRRSYTSLIDRVRIITRKNMSAIIPR